MGPPQIREFVPSSSDEDEFYPFPVQPPKTVEELGERLLCIERLLQKISLDTFLLRRERANK
jgi:hypothetical protein